MDVEVKSKSKRDKKHKKKAESSSSKSPSTSEYSSDSDSDDTSESKEKLSQKSTVKVKKEGQPLMSAHNSLPKKEMQRLKEDSKLAGAEKKPRKKRNKSVRPSTETSKKQKRSSDSSELGIRAGGLYQPDELKEILHGIYSKETDDTIAEEVRAKFPSRKAVSLKVKIGKIREEMQVITHKLTTDDVEFNAKGTLHVFLMLTIS